MKTKRVFFSINSHRNTSNNLIRTRRDRGRDRKYTVSAYSSAMRCVMGITLYARVSQTEEC